MSWYYVENGERNGPVEQTVIEEFVKSGRLVGDDYVWTKEFENWQKVSDVDSLSLLVGGDSAAPVEEPSVVIDLTSFEKNKKIFFIRIGLDRGGVPTDYGPFSITILKKLYKENRINAKTLVFTKGMKTWQLLGQVEGYEQIFEELPPVLDNVEKREFERKPMVARMFIKNKQEVFEGICRDISNGGMQVLVSGFPGSEGERISINVHPDNTDHHFVADGEIVRLLKGNTGFSFRFINLSEDAIKAIGNYIEAN